MPPLRPLDPSFPIERQIAIDASPVVLANLFMLDKADEETFLKVWQDDAAFMKRQPGFISTQLHRALGESPTYLNYAVWESNADFRAAFAHPEFRAKLSALSVFGRCLSAPVSEGRGPRHLRCVAAWNGSKSHEQNHPSNGRRARDPYDCDLLALDRFRRAIWLSGGRHHCKNGHTMGLPVIDTGAGGGGRLRLYLGKGPTDGTGRHENQAHANYSRQWHPGSHSIGVVPRIEGASRRVRYRLLSGASARTRRRRGEYHTARAQHARRSQHERPLQPPARSGGSIIIFRRAFSSRLRSQTAYD